VALIKARAAIECARPSDDILELMRQWRLRRETLTEIAERLNRLQIPTPKGFHWYASTVRTALARLPEFQKERNDECTHAVNDDCVISRNPFSRLNGLGSRDIPSASPLSARHRDKTDREITMADLAANDEETSSSARPVKTFKQGGCRSECMA
jgi:hypothetical protein